MGAHSPSPPSSRRCLTQTGQGWRKSTTRQRNLSMTWSETTSVCWKPQGRRRRSWKVLQTRRQRRSKFFVSFEGGREGEEGEEGGRERRGREGGRGWSPYKLNYTPSYIGSLENLAVNQMLWVGIYIHFESPNYIVLYSLSHNVQWEWPTNIPGFFSQFSTMGRKNGVLISLHARTVLGEE